MRSSVRRPTAVCSAIAIAFVAVGCGAAASARGGAQSSVASAPGASAPTSPDAIGAIASPISSPSSVATSPRPLAARLPEVVLDPKQPLRPLPELKVENIGLHVGGGPNDAETKAPFLSAVAERFPSFMDCYRKNEDPQTGGRFGIDLHIARTGGRARLEQPRTALRGSEFRACVTSVFEAVEFQKPKKGPTTISYSLRFQLVEAP
jgi:hypothetical protein